MKLLAAILLSFWSLASFAQNVVPVQANTNGHLLSPSKFLLTNVFGAGGIVIHRATNHTGNGIVLSNSSAGGGSVTFTDLNSASNAIIIIVKGYDAIGSNYLYSLIVGGGTGEVNINANAGATNATKFGWVNPKVGTTNYVKTVEPGFGMAATNQTTNLVLAVDGAVIPSQAQLNTASNLLRSLIVSGDLATSNGLVTLSIAYTVITSNALRTFVYSEDFAMSNVLQSFTTNLVTVASNALRTLINTKQFGSANLTNWSLFPTNLWNDRQGGSALLTNFSAMGITNIIAGSNTIIFTNAGRLVIASVPDGVGGGGGALSTNANQFGASVILTLKDGLWVTNMVGFGTTELVGSLFADDTLEVTLESYLLGGVYIYGPRTGGNTILGLNADLFAQSIVVSNGLTFDGTNLFADVTTPLLNAASNVLRTFTITSATTTSNSLLAQLIANDITTSNGVVTVLRAGDAATSNGVVTVLIANDITTSNGLVTAFRAADITTSNGVIAHANTKQHGSQLLTNFSAMGITNIVAGANVTITTNAGVLTITAASGSAGTLLAVTNFTNNINGWSPPTGTTRIKVRAWGRGGGTDVSGATPAPGGGGGAYGESVFTSTSSSNYDLAFSGGGGSTSIRVGGTGVDLIRVNDGQDSISVPMVIGVGGTVVLAQWGIPGQNGAYPPTNLVDGGNGGGSFGSSGGWGGGFWNTNGLPGMTPGGGGGGRHKDGVTAGTGGLGMIIIESYGTP